ncbi:MAG: hypothetical protein ACRC5T_10870 [Cetobacterium sp.]
MIKSATKVMVEQIVSQGKTTMEEILTTSEQATGTLGAFSTLRIEEINYTGHVALDSVEEKKNDCFVELNLEKDKIINDVGLVLKSAIDLSFYREKELKIAIADSTVKKSELTIVTAEADRVKNLLVNETVKGNDILSKNIIANETATSLNANLKASTTTATNIDNELKATNTNANNSNSTLLATVNNSVSKDNALKNTISDSIVKKDELIKEIQNGSNKIEEIIQIGKEKIEEIKSYEYNDSFNIDTGNRFEQWLGTKIRYDLLSKKKEDTLYSFFGENGEFIGSYFKRKSTIVKLVASEDSNPAMKIEVF